MQDKYKYNVKRYVVQITIHTVFNNVWIIFHSSTVMMLLRLVDPEGCERRRRHRLNLSKQGNLYYTNHHAHGKDGHSRKLIVLD